MYVKLQLHEPESGKANQTAKTNSHPKAQARRQGKQNGATGKLSNEIDSEASAPRDRNWKWTPVRPGRNLAKTVCYVEKTGATDAPLP